MLWFIGPALVLRTIARANLGWLAAGFAAAIMGSSCAGLRWSSLAAWLGMKTSRPSMIVACWRGMMANAVLPGAMISGDALRALHLQRLGHPLGRAAASVVLDRFSGLWALMTLSLITAATAQALDRMPGGVLPLHAGMTWFCALAALTMPLMLWHLSAKVVRRLPQRFSNLLGVIHERPHALRQYGWQILWSSAVQLAYILAFACGARAIGVDLPPWQYVVAAGPIFIFASLPVSVGGWGTREAAAVVTLGAFGVAREAAAASAIIYGIYSTMQGLLGALSLLHTKGKPNG